MAIESSVHDTSIALFCAIAATLADFQRPVDRQFLLSLSICSVTQLQILSSAPSAA